MIYKAGIIGCGWIATEAPDSHLRAYLNNHRVKLIAVCDKKYGKYPIILSKLTNGEITLSAYADYNEMLDEHKLDIISICTPVETHCKIVCDIAPYVKAIYCEKPMATTLEECDEMIKACEESNVVLQINHQRRFINPRLRFSRDLIDTGTHAFDLIAKYFGGIDSISKEQVITNWRFTIDLEYIPTQEHIFELDCVRSEEPMIMKGVEHLVNCLDDDRQSYSSGYEGREALKWALKYKECINELRVVLPH